jgi:hypothetical protein
MSTISLDTNLATYRQMVKCPVHYVLKPGGYPFEMEINPLLKNISPANAKAIGVQLYRRKKDKYGRYIPNWKDYYQPEVYASFARENIYRKDNPICLKCRRCWTR